MKFTVKKVIIPVRLRQQSVHTEQIYFIDIYLYIFIHICIYVQTQTYIYIFFVNLVEV